MKSNMFLSIYQQSFNLQICLFYTFSSIMYMPTKNIQEKKANKLCLMSLIVIESLSFLNR